MKIGLDARFLTHPQPGGFKTYTTNLLNALAQIEDGNDYVVYLDREPEDGCPLPDSPRFTYRVTPGNLPIIGMPYREQIALRRQIARDRLDLAHFMCNTAPLHMSIPYVVTLHDTIQVDQSISFGRTRQDHKQWALNFYSKQSILHAIGSAAQIITVSREERSLIHARLGVPQERISVTHLAPNPLYRPATTVQRQHWRRDLAEAYGIRTPFVLAVGYEPRKNIPLVLRSFAALAHDCPEVSLVVVAAQAEQRAAFQALADRLGLAQRIWILGPLPSHELVRFYNLAELFVFPSERESFGLPPLEAMACGAPTVALNATSLPEVLRDGAMLLDDLAVDTWSSAMGQVLENQALRFDLQQRGLRRAAMLTWHQCALDTLAVYRAAAVSAPASLEFQPAGFGDLSLQKDG